MPAFPDTTVVLLMAVGHLEALPDALAAAGWPADGSAAVIERASWPDERVSRGTVATLGARSQVVLGRMVGALAQAAPGRAAVG